LDCFNTFFIFFANNIKQSTNYTDRRNILKSLGLPKHNLLIRNGAEVLGTIERDGSSHAVYKLPDSDSHAYYFFRNRKDPKFTGCLLKTPNLNLNLESVSEIFYDGSSGPEHVFRLIQTEPVETIIGENNSESALPSIEFGEVESDVIEGKKTKFIFRHSDSGGTDLFLMPDIKGLKKSLSFSYLAENGIMKKSLLLVNDGERTDYTEQILPTFFKDHASFFSDNPYLDPYFDTNQMTIYNRMWNDKRESYDVLVSDGIKEKLWAFLVQPASPGLIVWNVTDMSLYFDLKNQKGKGEKRLEVRLKVYRNDGQSIDFPVDKISQKEEGMDEFEEYWKSEKKTSVDDLILVKDDITQE